MARTKQTKRGRNSKKSKWSRKKSKAVGPENENAAPPSEQLKQEQAGIEDSQSHGTRVNIEAEPEEPHDRPQEPPLDLDPLDVGVGAGNVKVLFQPDPNNVSSLSPIWSC